MGSARIRIERATGGGNEAQGQYTRCSTTAATRGNCASRGADDPTSQRDALDQRHWRTFVENRDKTGTICRLGTLGSVTSDQEVID